MQLPPSKLQMKSTDFEVPCTCQLQLLPLIQNNQIHFVLFKCEAAGSKSSGKLFQGQIESFDVFTGSRNAQKNFMNCKKCVCPTIFPYLKKIIILAGNSDAGTNLKLGFYQLINNKGYFCSWDLIPNSKHPTFQLELKNSLCVPYGKDGAVIVGVLNQVIQQQISVHLTLHMFNPVKTFGKNWRSVTLPLPQLQSPDGRKYQIQSCIIVENDLYCSLLLHGSKAFVCKIDLTSSQQFSKEVSNSWSLLDPLLCNCFLSVFNGEVFAITFKNVDGKSILEMRECAKSFVSSLDYQFKFPSIIKAVATSIVPELSNTLVVVYHDNKTNKCFVKKLSIYQ